MAGCYALMGFRFDSLGKVHAAFMTAPLGPYAFEIAANNRVADLSPQEQEHWAQREMRKRGNTYHGLYFSDRSPQM